MTQVSDPQQLDLLAELCARIGAPVPHDLLVLALTHPSAVREGMERILLSNQRLEFLGDTILGMIVAEHLYRSNAELPEGVLTQHKAAAVRGKSLAQAAKRLDLGKYLYLGRGEAESGGRARDTILADALEAIIGALYLAHGLDTTRDFVLRALADEVAAVAQHAVNVKNQLQETTQAMGLGTPVYQSSPLGGAPHECRFSSEVLLQGQVRGSGTGRTKKEAECHAAAAALAALDRP